MHSISTTGARSAPPRLENLQAARIAARVGVSPSVAAAIAGHAFGLERRDHGTLLANLTASRAEAHAHG